MTKIKLLFGGLALVFLLILGLSVSLFLATQDSPPYDDSDLRPRQQTLNLSPEDNAFTYYNQAQQQAVSPSEQDKKQLETMLDGKVPWDQRFADKLIAQNRAALAAFEQGQKRERLQYPPNPIPKTAEEFGKSVFPEMRNYTYLAQLKRLQIEVLRRQGKEQEALEGALNLFHFARQTSQDTLLAIAVGTSIMSEALDEMEVILKHTTLPPDILKAYIAKLEQYRVTGIALAEVHRQDYAQAWALVEIGITEGKTDFVAEHPDKAAKVMKIPEIPYLFHRNETQRQLGEYHRVLIANALTPYWETKPAVPPDPNPTEGLKFLQPNVLGRTLLGVMVPVFGDPARNTIHVPNTRISLFQTWIALKQYEHDHRKLPETLSELVPTYLKTVPLDPMDGKPLRYDPKARKLFSIGPRGPGKADLAVIF